MKLRNKLKLSFCILIILPIVLCMIAAAMIFRLQAVSMYQLYDVDSDTLINNIYSPMVLMEKMTTNVYNDMKNVADTNPQMFEDEQYLKQLDEILSEKLSTLIVRKNGELIYASNSIESKQIQEILPEFELSENVSDEGTYKGGDYQSLIKQINFKDTAGNQYSVSILTSLNQVIPQIKGIAIQIGIVIVLVLILTSLLLNLWIYGSIIRPLDRLKLATDNIKKGNLDFEMPKVSKDEIGAVCKDFEEMRIILKQSSEDKILSDKEEKELIRNISHDLKTPLTAIKGYVEGIIDGIADTPEKREKYLRTIANKVNDMDKLIDELTIYSKLDTNRIPYSFTKINLKAYFDDFCDEIGMDLESQGIDLIYKYHALHDLSIMADAEQMKRVVNNIISNSIKYMNPDRKGLIEIDIFDEGDYAHIIMKDNGKGIGIKELPHIFERFYRTDDSRNSKQGGSGIGLAIVKKIIDDHKGKIWAESVEGEGTTMHIYLQKENIICGYLDDKKKGSMNV